jgi:hypothetical protein
VNDPDALWIDFVTLQHFGDLVRDGDVPVDADLVLQSRQPRCATSMNREVDAALDDDGRTWTESKA